MGAACGRIAEPRSSTARWNGEEWMLHSIRRRLSRVEESLPLPITADRFQARVHRLAKCNSGNFDSARADLLKNLSDGELDSLTAELEQIAFGSDTAARDAAKREALAAAGYPAWDPSDEEPREEAW